MAKDLTGLFCPKSVVVIGASRTPTKVGAIVLRNIIDSGFAGKVYPINPNSENLNGIKCYKTVAEIPEVADVAIICLPAEGCLASLQEISAKGIKNVVIYAAGFKETGEAGQKLEQQLSDFADKNSINLLGPNCLGFINNAYKLNATFSSAAKTESGIKFISQSGAIASSILDWSNSIGLGFSEFITLGNKADITEIDILHYFKQQSDGNKNNNIWPIGMYLESIFQGEKFLELITELGKTHPIFILKPGKTKEAQTAMRSHTGSLAGADDVLETALSQAGTIRCQTLEDFFDLAKAFSWGADPVGPNVAVISNAGGPGVLSADAVSLNGLKLAQFDDQTKGKLAQILPRSASILDPVDLMGDALAERFGHAAEIIIENSNAESLLFILTPQLMTQIDKTAEYIAFLSGKYSKPIFCSFIGGNLVDQGEKILNQNHIPSFRYPERAIYAMATMWKHKQASIAKSIKDGTKIINVELPQDSSEIRAIIQKAVNEKYLTLDNVQADSVIKSIGIPTPNTMLVSCYEDALQFAQKFGWPVVLKLSAVGLLHKNEIGGVITDIKDEKSLDDAFHKMERKIEQLAQNNGAKPTIQVQKSILDGVEVIVGLKVDPDFGPVLMFGAGGSFVELIADKNLMLLPVGLLEAKSLVERSKIHTVLSKKGYPLDKLYDLIVRVSKLARVIPEASDIEINPVIVTLNGVWAVDTKVVMVQSNLPTQASAGPSSPKFRIATCLASTRMASKFHECRLETSEPFEFEAGQYISVKVSETAIRAYSVATRSDSTHLTLLIDTRPGGPGSMFFENIKPGDKMQFMGPFGKFTYCEDDEANVLLFMATGSGAGAVRCIIDRLLQEKNYTKLIKFYFGLTLAEEIFWKDHFDELAANYKNFSYEIAINKPDEKWTGSKGFITELIKKDFSDASKCAAYLCGHRAMISDACDILVGKGMPETRVYTERFV